MKGIIIYKGKYGATRQYAIWLGNMLNISAVVAGSEVKEELEAADYIIMGTSVYIGKLQLRKWMEQHRHLLLRKRLFLFLVAGTPVSEKEKLQEYINVNVSAEVRFRCSCFFLPGKLVFNRLSLPDKVMLRLGAWLARSRGDNVVMTDYNHVNRELLLEIVDAVGKLNEVAIK